MLQKLKILKTWANSYQTKYHCTKLLETNILKKKKVKVGCDFVQ